LSHLVAENARAGPNFATESEIPQVFSAGNRGCGWLRKPNRHETGAESAIERARSHGLEATNLPPGTDRLGRPSRPRPPSRAEAHGVKKLGSHSAGEHEGSFTADDHRVFYLRHEAAIGRPQRPAVLRIDHVIGRHREKRLDGEYKPLP
jgi:hypothetical protein